MSDVYKHLKQITRKQTLKQSPIPLHTEDVSEGAETVAL